MAGMNLGSDAGESLFCSSCLSRSESGVPLSTALHSTSPFFFTEQMNVICASCWPFSTRSCVSMRSINEVGPFPSKIGRYIGSAATCSDGVTLTCDHARSTIDDNAIKENAKARMGKYASGARRFFKRNLALAKRSGSVLQVQCASTAVDHSKSIPYPNVVSVVKS